MSLLLLFQGAGGSTPPLSDTIIEATSTVNEFGSVLTDASSAGGLDSSAWQRFTVETDASPNGDVSGGVYPYSP